MKNLMDRAEWGGSVPARAFTYTPEIEEDKLTGKFTRTGPDGVETVVQLDVANRVDWIRRGPAGAALMEAEYAYYANGLLQQVTYRNGASTEYTYYDSGLVHTIVHCDGGGLALLELSYYYDARDLPEVIIEYRPDDPEVLVSYTYDDRARLIAESRNGGTPYNLSYQYDPGGNRSLKADWLNQLEVQYHYDLEDPAKYSSANNRLMYAETFDTTGSGEELVSTTWYYYNLAGNVTRVVTNPAGSEDHSVTRFEYAANGQTVTYVMGETWQWNSDVGGWPGNYAITYAREFRYDGARQRYLNRELDPVALLSEQIVSVSETWSDYDGNHVYGDFTVDGGTVTNERSFEPGVGRSAAPGDPLGTEYYHADHLGTTRLLSDNGSAGILPASFTAFGERVQGASGDPLDRYGYAGSSGYQAHGEFPYLHVGARYYDPGVGRFLQRDPVGVNGGLNVYVYALNMPTVRIDPSGCGWFEIKVGIANGIIAITGGAKPNLPTRIGDRLRGRGGVPPGAASAAGVVAGKTKPKSTVYPGQKPRTSSVGSILRRAGQGRAANVVSKCGPWALAAGTFYDLYVIGQESIYAWYDIPPGMYY